MKQKSDQLCFLSRKRRIVLNLIGKTPWIETFLTIPSVAPIRTVILNQYSIGTEEENQCL